MGARTLAVVALNGSLPVNGCSPEAIDEAASRVLSSEAFANSKRLQRFLSYVVQRTVSGAPGELKEYNLALAVFDREASFDPRVDSIVRVEARRLRQQLDAYYQGPGRDDPIVITLPKGSYVPRFEDRLPAPAQRPRRSRLSRTALFSIAGVALVLLTGSVLWRQEAFYGARVPHHWRYSNSRLAVLDARDRICWEKTLPAQGPDTDPLREDIVLIEDIDGDRRPEVLVNSRPANIAAAGGSLLCFDWQGKLRWEFRYGRRMTFGNRTFDPAYIGRFVRVVKSGGRTFVLTVANHFLWYPSQTALLDPASGRLIEEYWHPGSIYHLATADLDSDQRPELLLGAINNPGEGLGHAALAVLKLPFSSAPHRAPPADGPFPAATGGGEFAYVLFPLPDVCRIMGKLPIIARFHVDQNQRILVQTPLVDDGGIVYYLSYNLQLLEYRFSDNFAALHERYYRQKLLDHQLSPSETESLGKLARFDAAPDGNSPELRRFWP